MRVWAAVMCISLACGGEGQRAQAPEPEPVEDSEPSTAVDPDAWLDVVRGVRVDMRVGRPANERGTPIDEVEAAIREAGGTLDCSDLTWVTDEEGVNEAQCQGSLPIEGTQGIVTANVRQYEIPDETDTPGLLNLVLGGPFLGANDDAIGEWIQAVRAKLEPQYGAPMNADETDPADLRWRAADRHLVVHDPASRRAAVSAMRSCGSVDPKTRSSARAGSDSARVGLALPSDERSEPLLGEIGVPDPPAHVTPAPHEIHHIEHAVLVGLVRR